ncbi:MAG: hypothetical protein ACE5IQ_04180 [Candidatus Methylomirabilales bacterium]
MGHEKAHAGGKGGNRTMETFAAWEKFMSEHMDTLFRNPAFLTSMGKALEHSLTMKEQLDRGIHAYLRAMSLPSTQDVGRILEAIAVLQRDVEGLKAAVDRLLRTSDGRAHSADRK